MEGIALLCDCKVGLQPPVVTNLFSLLNVLYKGLGVCGAFLK